MCNKTAFLALPSAINIYFPVLFPTCIPSNCQVTRVSGVLPLIIDQIMALNGQEYVSFNTWATYVDLAKIGQSHHKVMIYIL